jgi:membrane fusion protein (multidrug efflux system)
MNGPVGCVDEQLSVSAHTNALVKAEFAVPSTRVGGYVRGLPVAYYQRVKAGDIVAEIKTAEYAARVKATGPSLAKAQSALVNLANEEVQQRAAIRQAEASLRATRAPQPVATGF